MRSQDVDGAIGVHAVRAAAVRDVLFPFGKLTQSSLEIIDGYGNRTGNVAGGILAGGPGVEHDHIVRSSAFQELVDLHRLGVRAIAEMLTDQPFQVCESMLGDSANRRTQIEDSRVREAIRDEQAFLPTLDQGSLAKGLEMLGGIGEGQSDLGRQGIDGAFPLGQQLQHLEPAGTRKRLADSGELPVQAVFEFAVAVAGHGQVINRSFDYRLSSRRQAAARRRGDYQGRSVIQDRRATFTDRRSWVYVSPSPHSERSVTVGSTRVARHAGIVHAIRAAPARIGATLANVT